MANRGCRIFMYDHTIDELPLNHPNFHWSKVGICASHELNPEMKTISQLISENGHQSERNMILKMDIEGSEWTSIGDMSSDTLNQFSQIVLEIHWLTEIDNPLKCYAIMSALKHLSKTHQVVHVHANNCGRVAVIGGVTTTDAIETTWVRRQDHTFVTCLELFPTADDMPCDPNRGDLFLGAMGLLPKPHHADRR